MHIRFDLFFKDGRTRKIVRLAGKEVLDIELPSSLDKNILKKKAECAFETILDYAIQSSRFAD